MNFDKQRFLNFLRFEFAAKRSELLLPMLVPPALYSFWALSRLAFGSGVDAWADSSFIFCLLLGLGMTSLSYNRETHPSSATFYLMLPATTGERFATRWILSFALSFLGQLLVLSVLAQVFSGLSLLLGRTSSFPLLPSRDFLWTCFKIFVPAHAIFFAGSIFYKKNPLIKTILSSIGYSAVLLFTLMVLKIIGLVQSTMFESDNLVHHLQDNSSSNRVGVLAWQILLPVLLYIATYFRSQENEVRG